MILHLSRLALLLVLEPSQLKAHANKCLDRIAGRDCAWFGTPCVQQPYVFYKNTKTTTIENDTCLNWNASQYLKEFPINIRPNLTNRCQDPSKSPGGPWCNIADSQGSPYRWKYCYPNCSSEFAITRVTTTKTSTSTSTTSTTATSSTSSSTTTTATRSAYIPIIILPKPSTPPQPLKSTTRTAHTITHESEPIHNAEEASSDPTVPIVVGFSVLALLVILGIIGGYVYKKQKDSEQKPLQKEITPSPEHSTDPKAKTDPNTSQSFTEGPSQLDPDAGITLMNTVSLMDHLSQHRNEFFEQKPRSTITVDSRVPTGSEIQRDKRSAELAGRSSGIAKSPSHPNRIAASDTIQ